VRSPLRFKNVTLKDKRFGRARRMGRAGKRVWCDVRGHR
jgi:hypothetical protein